MPSALTHKIGRPLAQFTRPRLRKDTRWSSSSVPSTGNPTEHCRNLLLKHDYESFLISQFWPKGPLQNGYLALKAFSVELATIQDSVSSPLIGQMRMQFWRDAIKGLSEKNPPRHPIALALSEACQQFQIQPYHLKRLVDARDAELHTPVHLTTASLTDHAEATSSTILYTLLSLSSSAPPSEISHAASHIGVAQTVATLLRGLPYHASKGRMVIPAEITSKHGVSQEDVFRHGRDAKGLSDAVYEFAVLANDHLITARDTVSKLEGGKVPIEAMRVFLTGIPIGLYLERLEKAQFDVFDPRLQVRDWRLAWRIWRGYYTRSL